MERLVDVLSRWLAGRQFVGVCRACWCRQAVGEGSRCLSCGGVVARMRLS